VAERSYHIAVNPRLPFWFGLWIPSIEAGTIFGADVWHILDRREKTGAAGGCSKSCKKLIPFRTLSNPRPFKQPY